MRFEFAHFNERFHCAVFYTGISSWGGIFSPPSVEFPPMIDQYCHKLIHLKTISFDFPTVNLFPYTKTSLSITKSTIIDWLKIESDRNLSIYYPQLTTLLSGEAIVSAENSGKPLGGRGSAPNPAGVPLSWWEGACCPLSKNPTRSWLSASIFGPSGLIRQSFPTVFIPNV